MYATIADMIAAFGSEEMIALTDRDDTGRMVDAVALEALVRASSEADSYLCARYKTPVVPVDPALTDAVCQIARFRLVGAAASETDPARDRYDRAIAWLKMIAAGKAHLPGQVPAPPVSGSVLFGSSRRDWHRACPGAGDEQ